MTGHRSVAVGSWALSSERLATGRQATQRTLTLLALASLALPFFLPLLNPMSKTNSIADLATPSVRQMQGYIREKQNLEIKLLTGDLISGTLFWQDLDCICLQSEGKNLTIWKQAIAYIKPR